MNVDSPLHFDSRGGTAIAADADHIRQMIEMVLFTVPGERVNRPDFGCGLGALVFMPNSPEVAATVQFTVMASLQKWLGDLIEVQDLTVDVEDSALFVTVVYAIRQTGEPQTATFSQGGATV